MKPTWRSRAIRETTDQFIAAEDLGTVLVPGNEGFDAARQAFNLLVDQRPVAVALPAGERQVAAIVRAARRQMSGSSVTRWVAASAGWLAATGCSATA